MGSVHFDKFYRKEDHVDYMNLYCIETSESILWEQNFYIKVLFHRFQIQVYMTAHYLVFRIYRNDKQLALYTKLMKHDA